MTTRSTNDPPPLLTALPVAAFTFLCVLGVGTALVVGAKLQVTGLGAEASPWAIFEAITVVSLGSLGIPVDIGGVQIQVFSLGGIVAVGWGAVSAARQAERRGDRPTDDSSAGGVARGSIARTDRPARHLARWVLLFSSCLGVLCLGAAVVARWPIADEQVRVSPGAAVLYGAAWGLVFASVTRVVSARPQARDSEPWRSAIGTARHALVWFGVLCLAVVVAGGLVRVVTQSSSPAAAAGTLVHGAAFAPNLGIAVGSLALGAPVEAGFGTLAGDAEPRVPGYSLLDWNGEQTPLGAWALLSIPAAALVLAGRRVARSAAIPLAAFVFAVACGLLALLGEARIGLDVEERGFANFAPDARRTFVLALGWALVGLTLGWLLRPRGEGSGKEERDNSR